MSDTAQVVGLGSAILGAGMSSVRAALKRYDWELPLWVDAVSGIGGLVLMGVGALLLWRTFLQWFGVTISIDSPWPATILYAAVSAGLIFAAGYLPANVKPISGRYPRTWEPALAESMLENLEAFKEHSSLPIKVIATLEGVKAAVSFVNMVRYFGWQPQVNHADGAYVFPAATTFRGVIIRYRESKRAESYPVYRAVCELVDSPETIFFPEDDAFNFVQVEIGDVPEYYRGAPGSF